MGIIGGVVFKLHTLDVERLYRKTLKLAFNRITRTSVIDLSYGTENNTSD